jgi:hypothetical protein
MTSPNRFGYGIIYRRYSEKEKGINSSTLFLPVRDVDINEHIS